MKRTKIFLCAIVAFILMTATYASAGGMHTGKVIESMTGGGYTYMHIKEGGEKFWIAGPQTTLGKGDKVSFDEQMWMHNFQSKALNRKFDSIMFVGGISSGSAKKAAQSAAKPKRKKSIKAAGAKPAGPAALHTIRSLFENKDALEGKAIKIKGTVTKISRAIMRMDWVHVEDGTTYQGNNKVVFTSKDDSAEVGDKITAQGIVVLDKDFGAGYFYPVIIQQSRFTK